MLAPTDVHPGLGCIIDQFFSSVSVFPWMDYKFLWFGWWGTVQLEIISRASLCSWCELPPPTFWTGIKSRTAQTLSASFHCVVHGDGVSLHLIHLCSPNLLLYSIKLLLDLNPALFGVIVLDFCIQPSLPFCFVPVFVKEWGNTFSSTQEIRK